MKRRTYHTLNHEPLQPWYRIQIVNHQGTKWVYFRSRIHKRRTLRMPVGYSCDWSDQKILWDWVTITAITSRYGFVTHTPH